jgi:hypothetical protein
MDNEAGFVAGIKSKTKNLLSEQFGSHQEDDILKS